MSNEDDGSSSSPSEPFVIFYQSSIEFEEERLREVKLAREVARG